MVLIRSLLALLFVTASSVAVQAGLTLDLDSSATLINSGDDVTITMTLRDDGTIAGAGGLFSASGVILSNNSASASATIGASDITGNLAFANTIGQGDGTGGSLPFDMAFPNAAPAGFTNLAGITQNIGVGGLAVAPGGGDVLVGQFVFNITGAAGSSISLTSADLGAGFAGTIGGDLSTIFDPTNSDTVTITIAGGVIPEPSSVVIWGVMACTGCVVYRRRKQKAVAKA